MIEWSDEGIVVSARGHGESDAIVEVFTSSRGRFAGLVKGGLSRRRRPTLSLGNSVEARWTARLEGQLGRFSLETRRAFRGVMSGSSEALTGLSVVTSLCRLVPERSPHAAVHRGLEEVLEVLEMSDRSPPWFWSSRLVLWELLLLRELGFGLRLSRCAATGRLDDLIYVSPRSGRAVSAIAGEPWKDKLLRLPRFVTDSDAEASMSDVVDGFRLSGFFLDRWALSPLGQSLPEERSRLVARLAVMN